MRALGIRHGVLALATSLAFITYLDRVCISMTAPFMMRDLSLTPVQMGFIFSSFTLAYAIFEIPTGWLGDRIGPRRVLTRIVVWWSFFTMATGFAAGFKSLLGIRFLFGAGEAGAWPNVAKAFASWFPQDERGTAQGVFFMGAHLGGGIVPLIVAMLLTRVHWRMTFLLFSCPGFIWAVVWYAWFRDTPPGKNLAGEGLLPQVGVETTTPTRNSSGFNMLGNPSVLALCAAYFTQGYGFYFYITWLPSYLQHLKGMGSASLGLLSGLPLLASVLADVLGGITTDLLTRRFGFRIGRCLVAAVSLAVAGIAIGFACFTAAPLISACVISLAAASSNFLLGASWGACVDLAGARAGIVSATMNTAGQIGGTLSPIIFAWITQTRKSSTGALGIMAVLYLIGSLCWFWVRPPVEGTEMQSAFRHAESAG